MSEELTPICRWCMREFLGRESGEFFIQDGRAHLIAYPRKTGEDPPSFVSESGE